MVQLLQNLADEFADFAQGMVRGNPLLRMNVRKHPALILRPSAHLQSSRRIRGGLNHHSFALARFFSKLLAQIMLYILEQCGDNLTRDNVMYQATHMHEVEFPMLLPGVKVNTSPKNYLGFNHLQLEKFDGKRWGRVEDRRGSLGHLATLRFPSSLIEPDVPISGIRLSDWFHREAHGATARGKCSRRSRPSSL